MDTIKAIFEIEDKHLTKYTMWEVSIC